jgi:hypothetical protein
VCREDTGIVYEEIRGLRVKLTNIKGGLEAVQTWNVYLTDKGRRESPNRLGRCR